MAQCGIRIGLILVWGIVDINTDPSGRRFDLREPYHQLFDITWAGLFDPIFQIGTRNPIRTTDIEYSHIKIGSGLRRRHPKLKELVACEFYPFAGPCLFQRCLEGDNYSNDSEAKK